MSKDFITRLSELHEAAGLGEIGTLDEYHPQFLFPQGSKAFVYAVNARDSMQRRPWESQRDLLVLLINSLPGIIEVLKAANQFQIIHNALTDEHLVQKAEQVNIEVTEIAFHALNTKGGADADE